MHLAGDAMHAISLIAHCVQCDVPCDKLVKAVSQHNDALVTKLILSGTMRLLAISGLWSRQDH